MCSPNLHLQIFRHLLILYSKIVVLFNWYKSFLFYVLNFSIYIDLFILDQVTITLNLLKIIIIKQLDFLKDLLANIHIFKVDYVRLRLRNFKSDSQLSTCYYSLVNLHSRKYILNLSFSKSSNKFALNFTFIVLPFIKFQN